MKNSNLFKLHNATDLSNQDFKVLALLYQPLMGLEAHSLYITFYQLLNKTGKDTYSHNELFDLINIRQVEYLKLRHKLEALSLLEVYQKEETFLYILKSPLTARQFLLDTVFGSYLQSEIGEKNLNFIANLFKIDIPSKEHYDNITKSFDSLYEFKTFNLLNLDYELQGKQQNGGSQIHHKFNYEKFVELIPERLKSIQLLTERFKEMVVKVSFVYQFDVTDMVQVYETSYNPAQKISFAQFNLKAKQYYESKNKLLSIKQKDMSEDMMMDSVSPQIIVQKYAKMNQQGIALQTANSLLERNHVEPGIINVILMFVLKHKEGVLPNIKYLETVLQDWLSRGVQTTEDALNYALEIENKWEKKDIKPNKAEPDWLDDYIKDLANMEG